MTDLSVLVCSTHTRYKTFAPKIMAQLFDQYEALPADYQTRVEILILTDNKHMMLGAKRNHLIDIAQGTYVQFIDDDDRIHPDLLRLVLDAADSHPDVITFLAAVSLNGDTAKICKYSTEFTADRNLPNGYERIPNHICAVKRDLAVQVDFPSIPYGEDSGYSKQLLSLLKTEHHISEILYWYDYCDATTEAQETKPAAVRARRHRPAKPVVDMVILSDAVTQPLTRMTQHTINTAISGAAGLPLNVIVVEQQPRRTYQHAQTVHLAGVFGFNKFANHGARLGAADWIAVCNNDLEFHPGWLKALLAADHPLVSPKNPGDPRQQQITENTTGDVNGRHLSGWCYLIRRELWQQIGGLDEEFTFWCCDDALIEQAKTVGVQPMLVPAARVKHLVSATLTHHNQDRDQLTWAQVEHFNHKYGHQKFINDPRFAAYRQRKTMQL